MMMMMMMPRRTKSNTIWNFVCWDLFCTPSSSSHNSDANSTPSLRGPLISNSAEDPASRSADTIITISLLTAVVSVSAGSFSKHSDKIKPNPKGLNSRYDPQKDQYTPEQKVQQEIFDKTL